jgi:hypothetical protein
VFSICAICNVISSAKYVLHLNFNIIVIIIVTVYPGLRGREVCYDAADVSGMTIDEVLSTDTSVNHTHKDEQN